MNNGNMMSHYVIIVEMHQTKQILAPLILLAGSLARWRDTVANIDTDLLLHWLPAYIR